MSKQVSSDSVDESRRVDYETMFIVDGHTECPQCGGAVTLIEPRGEDFNPLDSEPPLDRMHSCDECSFYKQLSESSDSDYWEAQQ
jgi:hypothetical protein